jgi:uroporphyrinogen-III synthase
MHLLNTRTPDQRLAEECAQEKILLDSIPFIKTETIVSYELSKIISAAAMEDLNIVFTSSNAVEAIINYLQGLQPEWKVFCTTPATQRTVEQLLPSASIVAIASTAEDLARQMIGSGSNKFIFFCGDQRRHELPDMLKAEKISIEEIVVYRTIATPVSVAQDYDAIAFYSPSAVTSFFSVNKIPLHTVLFCIGKTTAAAIDKKIANTVIISEESSGESLLQTIIRHFRNNPVAINKARKFK